ncbi:MAG: hypothetical protein PHR15_07780 [Atopobiaceae bacterium]|nr:hypothetical protein [Atopobiaceae bacterium]MDD3176620.1 hypothetical protein [Atopobiaceae bacterium]MDD3486711.1 hypothetical protein [Atopobiaceae bacterium]MDD4381353.1 hypothetical protein [Atopobiaceae bacterium]
MSASGATNASSGSGFSAGGAEGGAAMPGTHETDVLLGWKTR